ncbi:TPA: hypothetical protein N0F65_006745 [Lagenidium giganteum]|uniref:tRNA-specific adenosine deaminase 1 n=1 Tax=Lagenidium giganteum TaxID=4803 RepID=A0AAV2YZC3_9STRA|nr:TPA: hypothetical protein N0F65_006745 [Lagenidium giganteum]
MIDDKKRKPSRDFPAHAQVPLGKVKNGLGEKSNSGRVRLDLSQTTAPAVPPMHDPYHILNEGGDGSFRPPRSASMISMDSAMSFDDSYNLQPSKHFDEDEIRDSTSLPKDSRPAQPANEREYFEKLWAENFERSEAKVSNTTAYIPAGAAGRLNRIKGFSLARDAVSHKLYAVFRMEIECIVSEKQWTIYRRFHDFKQLAHQLKNESIRVPTLPTKTLMRSLETNFLRKRQLELDRWLREVLMLVSLENCKVETEQYTECCGNKGYHTVTRVIRRFLTHSANQPPNFEIVENLPAGPGRPPLHSISEQSPGSPTHLRPSTSTMLSASQIDMLSSSLRDSDINERNGGGSAEGNSMLQQQHSFGSFSETPGGGGEHESASRDEFTVLSAATGTKCLGRRDMHESGMVVNDCHAEVLARRAFLRYLYLELRNLGKCDATQSIFQRHEETGRLELKPQHSLHLFVSEAPCGDSAIYRLKKDVVDNYVNERVERAGGATKDCCDGHEGSDHGKDAAVERSELRLTGAKHQNKRRRIGSSSESDACNDRESKFEQTIGATRVKSGRSDLPPDKQTLSMSCSDKLAKWNALGIQGTLLLQWFEPLHLQSVVVSYDSACESVAEQQQALQRALRGRLEVDELKPSLDLKSLCNVYITTAGDFQRVRTKDRQPASLALNWTRTESRWAPESSKWPFVASKDVEVLIGATGLKEGAKKLSKLDAKAMEKVSSRLSKFNMFKAAVTYMTGD